MEKSSEQKLIIEYLLSSPDTFALCKRIIKPEYFNPELRQSVQFIHDYFDGYNNIPPFEMLEAKTDISFKQHVVTHDMLEYTSTEVEKFCKFMAIKQAVIKCSNLIHDDDPGKIQQIIEDAVSVSLERDTGSDYFLNVHDRLIRMSQSPQRISTGWTTVDDMLGGGLARTELIIWTANSGGGKSITLANYGLNMVMQKYNVLYLSLELSVDLVEQRFDTIITGYPSVMYEKHIDDITKEVTRVGMNAGTMITRRLPAGTSARDIRILLKEIQLKYGFIPDVLIVDYLDQMGTNEKTSADNVSQKDKLATEQLRDILEDYNMIGATASQQNREAINATEINQSHIAGGLTKANTADWVVSIILTPAMKAKGDIIFAFIKSRSSDAVGKQTLLAWDNIRLKVSDSDKQTEYQDEVEDFIAKKKGSKKGLLDIMDI